MRLVTAEELRSGARPGHSDARMFLIQRRRRGSRAQAAVQPPSIDRFAPVIALAASEHRYTASEATSSTVMNSLVGCAAKMTSRLICSSFMPRALAVSGKIGRAHV